jgi:2-keto-3-deoxy-L-rhamnonate aldolase RhmA
MLMNLKQKIRNKTQTIGSWITLGHPGIAEIMSKAGFDWLTIDLEHSGINIQQTEDLIRVIELCDVSPLVRITNNDPNLIKRVLDAGSHGIIVPMVNSLADAQLAIQSAYYPPKGKRSFGLARAQRYGVGFKDYLERSKDETVIIVQIEHIDALKELEAILSLDEIDGYIIGPYDLSGSMNIPGQFENSEYLDVISTINEVAKKLGKSGGIHIVEPDLQLLEIAKKEYNFIAYSVDFRMIDVASRSALSID